MKYILSIGVFLTLASPAYAWVEPVDGQNIAAPLNTGNQLQQKEGGLIINSAGTPDGLQVTGDIVYSSSQNKLDVKETSDSFVSTIRSADLNLGHSSRHGTPGRALVDMGSALDLNYNNDWPVTEIGGTRTTVLGDAILGDGNDTVTINQQNASGEGGEINIQGSGGFNGFSLDSVNEWARIFWYDSTNHHVLISNYGDGKGNLYVEGDITSESSVRANDSVCIRGDCRTTWPEASSASSWWEWREGAWDYGQYMIGAANSTCNLWYAAGVHDLTARDPWGQTTTLNRTCNCSCKYYRTSQANCYNHSTYQWTDWMRFSDSKYMNTGMSCFESCQNLCSEHYAFN